MHPNNMKMHLNNIKMHQTSTVIQPTLKKKKKIFPTSKHALTSKCIETRSKCIHRTAMYSQTASKRKLLGENLSHCTVTCQGWTWFILQFISSKLPTSKSTSLNWDFLCSDKILLRTLTQLHHEHFAHILSPLSTKVWKKKKKEKKKKKRVILKVLAILLKRDPNYLSSISQSGCHKF